MPSDLKLIPESIVSSQSVSIDASSGATLTSHAILEAVEDALSKADTDISQWQKTESVSIRNPKKEISTDVAIIGGGIAGLSAALRLQQMGIDTTVIEKDSESGGVMKDITSAVQLTSSMYQPVVRQEEEQETDEEKLQEEKEEEKQKNTVLWVLAIIGAVAAVAGIAFAVYHFFAPDYLEDFEEDFDDDFDDYFEDEEE